MFSIFSVSEAFLAGICSVGRLRVSSKLSGFLESFDKKRLTIGGHSRFGGGGGGFYIPPPIHKCLEQGSQEIPPFLKFCAH